VPTNIDNCYATGAVLSYAANANHYTGGFVGYIVGTAVSLCTITRCYASGGVTAVNSNSGSYFSTGGLAGYASNTDISESWASGSVSAGKGTGGTTAVYAGGLAGGLVGSSSITNCYALGSVTADNPNTDNVAVYAGGLVGYVQISLKAVSHNFAAGTVTAQSASGSAIYAGGVVGYKASGVLTNNAARGLSVTVKGSDPGKVAARVYAYPASGGGADNFALNTMLLQSTDTYYDPRPAFTVSSENNGTAQNGTSKLSSDFGNSVFWSTTLDFNSVGSYTGTAPWDFGGVARGYPALANVAGAQ
jgi:hypothetical protein